MNSNFLGSMVVVLTGIIGVATLAVLVSKNAQTPQVITAGGNAFSNMLATAVSPVTGSAGGSSSGMGMNLSGLLPTLQL